MELTLHDASAPGQTARVAGTSGARGLAPEPTATERRLHAEIAQLRLDMERLRSRATHIERLGQTGIWDFEPVSGRLVWSDGTYRIFGVPPEAGITIDQAVAFYPVERHADIMAGVGEAATHGCGFDLMLPFTSAIGAPGWVRSLGYTEHDPDGVQHVFGFVRDVTREVTTERQLRQLAERDALTDVWNRRAFMDRLGDAVAAVGAGAGGGLTLVVLDVDHFKDINDVHGHAVGDQLLFEMSRRLTASVRPTDTVARLGGDEFAVILPGLSGDATVSRRVAMILSLFETPIDTTAGPLEIGISLGAAQFPEAGATPDELLRDADVALYQAKSVGRGQACVFHPGLGTEAAERLGLLAEVRAALGCGQMEVYYQPIIDLWTGVVRGLEALVRWRHPTRGLLTPAAFLPALADPALSVEIGNFVLARGLAQLRAWLDAGEPVTCLNVNVSEGQLRRGETLVQRVLKLLHDAGIAPDRLKLELLESAFLGRQADAVAQTIRQLQGHGIVVALDDFGTGYASLTHLKQFAVGRIKIDRSFVADVCDDASDAAIAHAIINLGRNLGIRVTAEGIETPEQLAFLLAAGCDCGQGYLFARPMPAERVPAFLADWYGGAGRALLGVAPPAFTGPAN